MADLSICSIDICGNPSKGGSKGYCCAHYKRLLKYGDPQGGPRGMRARDGEPFQWLVDHVGYQGEDCLKWPYADRGNGYGAVTNEFGELDGAHRCMCRLAHGSPPENFLATHKCGKGHEGCVNPQHLEWKDHSGNSQDRYIHGTIPLGENHRYSKLTETQVKEIRNLRGKMIQHDIAKIYGIRQDTVSAIQLRQSWAWLE